MSSNITNFSKEEKIGFHKGALTTLFAERNELLRLVGITEGIIKNHVIELNKIGIDVKVNAANIQNPPNESISFFN